VVAGPKRGTPGGRASAGWCGYTCAAGSHVEWAYDRENGP
jgi:hypothetical protein